MDERIGINVPPPPARPCLEGCGRPVEPVWDGGWWFPGGYCLACEAAREERACRSARIQRLEASRIPERYRGYRLDRLLPPTHEESLEDFARRVEGRPGILALTSPLSIALRGLLRWRALEPPRPSVWLSGPPGVGKTLVSCALAEELLEAGEDVLFVNEQQFFALVAREFTERGADLGSVRDLRECGLLLFDGADPGPHRLDPPKPWMSRALVGLIHERYNSRRPVIWTSNNSLETYGRLWADPKEGLFEEAIVGRLFEMCGRSELRMEGPDWRLVGFPPRGE